MKVTKAELESEVARLQRELSETRTKYTNLFSDNNELTIKYNNLKEKLNMATNGETPDTTVLQDLINGINEINVEVARDFQKSGYAEVPRPIKFGLYMGVFHLVAFLLFGLWNLVWLSPSFALGIFLTADVYGMVRYWNYISTLDTDNEKN